VLLIALTGVAPKEVIVARGLNTIIGGAFALLAYVVWPTWERNRLPDLFAALLDAYRNSLISISRKLINPAAASVKERERTRQTARIARSNLEASLERLAAEPGVTAEQMTQANAMLASSHRFAHAMIALEAGIPQSPTPAPEPEFKMFCEAAIETLELLSLAVKGQRVSEREFPDLRAAYLRLTQASNVQRDRNSFIYSETDRMTNSLNTLREQIRAWRRTTGESKSTKAENASEETQRRL
jgi:uncharacterized membrane protein YccC